MCLQVRLCIKIKRFCGKLNSFHELHQNVTERWFLLFSLNWRLIYCLPNYWDPIGKFLGQNQPLEDRLRRLGETGYESKYSTQFFSFEIVRLRNCIPFSYAIVPIKSSSCLAKENLFWWHFSGDLSFLLLQISQTGEFECTCPSQIVKIIQNLFRFRSWQSCDFTWSRSVVSACPLYPFCG